MDGNSSRRPLKTRAYRWPHQLAHYFVTLGVTPNQMSLVSIGAALLGALCYLCVNANAGPVNMFSLLTAAVFIQLRLLANMLDGLMAVEEGKKTPTGIIYNEVPDRVADVMFLVAAGYAAGSEWLGWLAALLAISTAYVRAFGGAVGLAQDFSGPMAKPHRMFVLTVGSVVAAFADVQLVLFVTLVVIVLGCLVTLVRRLNRIVRGLTDGSAA